MVPGSEFSYVLITPAHNEEQFIEKTIRSMVNQTVKPKQWIIVNDGSTDKTGEIVEACAADHDWITPITRPPHADRQFAAKVHAFNAGLRVVEKSDFDFIGNLDADLSFDADYMDYLLRKFAEDPQLGVAGTPFVEDASEVYDYRYSNIEHVSGACQLFRRQCFLDIGGYRPISGGGIDWVAVTSARMKGWKTRTFTEKSLFHHRSMGTGRGNVLKARFRLGVEDYYLGSHPLWALLRMAYQMKKKPYGIGGFCLGLGFLSAFIRRPERPVPAELVRFYRREQMDRLKKKLRL